MHLRKPELVGEAQVADANNLVRDGRAPLGEVMRVLFGHWPPNGLEAAADLPNYTLHLFREHDERFLRNPRMLAYAKTNSPHVHLKPDASLKPLTHVLLAHEVTHVLQNYARLKKTLDGPPVDEASILRALVNENLRNQGQSPIPPAGKDGEESYYWTDKEFQARVAAVVVEGYKTWNLMPASRLEFLAAMNAVGIDVGSAAKRALRDVGIAPHGEITQPFSRPKTTLSDEEKERLACFVSPEPSPTLAEAVRAMNELKDDIRSDVRYGMLMSQVAPYLYGHFRELLRDPEGRKRIEHSPMMPMLPRLDAVLSKPPFTEHAGPADPPAGTYDMLATIDSAERACPAPDHSTYAAAKVQEVRLDGFYAAVAEQCLHHSDPVHRIGQRFAFENQGAEHDDLPKPK